MLRTARKKSENRSRRSFQIHALMLKKTMILNGNEGVLHINRYIFKGNPDSVFRTDQPLILHFDGVPLCVGII